MMVWLLFIIDLMGLFFYNKIGSIISIGDLPTTNIIEPKKEHLSPSFEITDIWLVGVPSISDTFFKVRQEPFCPQMSFVNVILAPSTFFVKLSQSTRLNQDL